MLALRKQMFYYINTNKCSYAYLGVVEYMIIKDNLSIMEKLEILSDAAKYDVSCSSSGVERNNNKKGIGNSRACGICHSFSADGRCISLLKILLTNECIYNCKYCINRASNDVVRATFTPEEICELTVQFYKRNYIEGLFLSSGIIQTPDETMKRMLKTVIILRTKYNFGGYIHMKAIPVASEELIKLAGYYVDRMSVNLELPTNAALKKLAPSKSRDNILKPMRMIQHEINSNMNLIGVKKKTLEEIRYKETGIYLQDNYIKDSDVIPTRYKKPVFVPAGQSTQMIVGATDETDYHLVTIAEALYNQYSLKRVFYSAFVNVNMDVDLPLQPDGTGVPLLREHRLYQADWLMRFYGFKASELLSEKHPNFNSMLDPKCDWALRNLGIFPVEVNKADYNMLLRVPGIGVKSAKRILYARKHVKLDFNDLKKIGVVLKRAIYFITCNGHMMYNIKIDQDYITNCIIDSKDLRKIYDLEHHNTYKQLSFFDDNYNYKI